MIVFDRAQQRFNYRIAGVAVHGGQVLVFQAEGEPFWSLPGGRAELGEPAERTLEREMREELNTEVEVVRPLWFVENFFHFDARDYHEVALYFLMRLPQASPLLQNEDPFIAWDEGTQLEYQWVPATSDCLSALPLLPSFLHDAMNALPDSLQHVVHYD